MRSALRLAAALAMLCLLTVSFLTDQASAGAAVSIHPAVTYASPGQIIRVYLWKDLADSLFDGYEAVITFNPSDLQLQLGAAEESVMTKDCSNRWWYTSPGTGTVFVSHVRMCPPNTLVSGPGALSSLSFKVLREGRIVISKNYFWFTRAGYWIKDVAWEDGLVLSGSPAGISGETPVEPETASIEVCPNPGREVAIQVWPAGARRAGSGQLLEIYDIGGRLVRTLGVDGACAGPYSSTWDGTDAQGKGCSPGIYYLSFGSATSRTVRTVVLVR
jgi:hypothetical protein